MKITTILCSIAFSAVASASTIPITFNGQSEIQQTFQTVKTITKHRSEPYQGTCYTSQPYQDYVCDMYSQPIRPIIASLDKRCIKVPGRGPVCNDDRVPRTRPRPRPIPRRTCRYVTRYRAVGYSCTKTRDVSYSVNVNVKAFTKLTFEDQRTYPETVNFNMNIEEASNIVLSQNNSAVFVVTNLQSKIKSQTNNSEEILVKGNVKIYDASSFAIPFKQNVTAINLTRSTLSFKTGNFSNDFPVQVTIKLTRNGSVFRKRETVLNKVFNISELNTISSNGALNYSINLNKLNVDIIKKKKYDVVITLSAQINGDVRNDKSGKLTNVKSVNNFKVKN